jgi:hypothetical protein
MYEKVINPFVDPDTLTSNVRSLQPYADADHALFSNPPAIFRFLQTG